MKNILSICGYLLASLTRTGPRVDETSCLRDIMGFTESGFPIELYKITLPVCCRAGWSFIIRGASAKLNMFPCARPRVNPPEMRDAP
jgi:hypothetical protein